MRFIENYCTNFSHCVECYALFQNQFDLICLHSDHPHFTGEPPEKMAAQTLNTGKLDDAWSSSVPALQLITSTEVEPLHPKSWSLNGRPRRLSAVSFRYCAMSLFCARELVQTVIGYQTWTSKVYNENIKLTYLVFVDEKLIIWVEHDEISISCVFAIMHLSRHNVWLPDVIINIKILMYVNDCD